MSFKNSWDKILFTFNSRVVIEMMEREQRVLIKVGIVDHDMAWYYIYVQYSCNRPSLTPTETTDYILVHVNFSSFRWET
jgi:hypothetical protein